MEHETFWTLLGNAAHWEFELFLMAIFDGLLGALLLPRFWKWVRHHKGDDQQLEDLQKKVKLLQEKLGITEDQ